MTDAEMLLIDAEFWMAYNDSNLQDKLYDEVQQYIPRISFLYSLYGVNRDSEGMWIEETGMPGTRREQRCFFALLIAAAEGE